MSATPQYHSPVQSYQQTMRRKWLFPLTLLALTLLVTGSIIVFPRLAAHAASPSIRLIPQSGAYSPKQSIHVNGLFFTANETVKVYWNYSGPGTGILESTVTADSKGAFTTAFKKPLAATGIYTVAAIGQTSNAIVQAPFHLLPYFYISPLAGGPGTKVFLFGNAFGAGETVNIYWNYSGPGTGTLISTAIGNTTGSFKATGIIPQGTQPGMIPITGVGQTSQATGSYNFLLYPPTVMLAPLSGSAGTTLTISGYGFKGGEKVSLFGNNATTAFTTITSTPYGYCAPTTLTIPNGTTAGAYTVKAVGLASKTVSTNTFTVINASSTLNPTSGPVGATINVSAHGYAPGETVNILWNYTGPGTGTQVATTTATSAGLVNSSFAVPAQVIEAVNVAVVGVTSNRVTQNPFTLNASLAVNPATNSPGNSTTVTGTGFSASENVNIFLDSTSTQPLATAIATSAGDISQAISLPLATTPGNHTLIGVGQTSNNSYSTPLPIDTSWGDFGFDHAHHRQNYTEHGISTTNVANMQVKWTATTGTTNTDLEDSPVYANGLVYIVTPDGTLNAYTATTGQLTWHYTPDDSFPFYSSPLVDPINNLVFFSAVPNFDPGAPAPFYALDAQTGMLKWSVIVPWNEYGFPTLAFGNLYFGTSRETGPGTVVALDELSGHVTWQIPTNGGSWGAVAADTASNLVFASVGNPANQILALNPQTGAITWQFSIPNSGPDDDPGSGLTVSQGLVYADSKNGSIYAINESNGTLAWSTAIGAPNNGDVSSQAVATNGLLYVGSLDNNLYALNATTGQIVWKALTGGGIDSTPALANGVVYVGSFDKHIYAIDATSGTILWSYATGNMVYSSPILVNAMLYCGSTDGKLYAFGL